MDKSKFLLLNAFIVVLHKALVYGSIFFVEYKYIDQIENFTILITLINGVIVFANSGVVERALYTRTSTNDGYIKHNLFITLILSISSGVMMFYMSQNIFYATSEVLASFIISSGVVSSNFKKVKFDLKSSLRVYIKYIILPIILFVSSSIISLEFSFLIFVFYAFFIILLDFEKIFSSLKSFKFSFLKLVVSYNAPYFIQNFFNYLSGFGMNLIIALIINESSMVRYTKIIIVSSIISLIAQSVNNLFLGVFKKYFKDKDYLYDRLFSLTYFVVINIFLVIFLYINSLISYFDSSDQYLIILTILPYLFNIVYWVNSKYFALKNENWKLVNRNIMSGLASVFIAFPFIYLFGFIGLFVYLSIYPLVRSLFICSYKHGLYNKVNAIYLLSLPIYFIYTYFFKL